MVTVCISAFASRRYARIAREAARSVLANSDFDVRIIHDTTIGPVRRRGGRLRAERIRRPVDRTPADVFNAKLDALALCIENTDDDLLMMFDADAVMVRPVHTDAVVDALEGRGLAMVEQTGIRGTSTRRAQFLDHYRRVSHAAIAPELPVPPLERFRYYNSGVVLFTRETALEVIGWTTERRRDPSRHHEVGEWMIADQDHLQVFANSVDPASCAQLPWYWNHCEHWDDGFPRRDAWILHFSNFARGPGGDTLSRMRRERRRTRPRIR